MLVIDGERGGQGVGNGVVQVSEQASFAFALEHDYECVSSLHLLDIVPYSIIQLEA